METRSPHSPRPAPLATAAFVCRSVRGLEALPHVAELISA
ncbi:hypothetical protein Gpo141_00014982, partial [Globisporangium polare]